MAKRKTKKERPRDTPSKAFRNIMIGLFFGVLIFLAIWITFNIPNWIPDFSFDLNQTLSP